MCAFESILCWLHIIRMCTICYVVKSNSLNCGKDKYGSAPTLAEEQVEDILNVEEVLDDNE